MTSRWPIVKLWIYRELAFEMIKRELLAINKGSILGFAWLFISPLFQTAGYLVITSQITKQPTQADSIAFVFAGVGTWQVFSRVLAEAPTFILSRMDIIKQVFFPIEILPLPRLLSTLLSCSFMFMIALIVRASEGHYSLKVLLLPAAILLGCMFLITCSWALCVAGVVMRDLREIMTILMSFLIFASPAIYPLTGPSNPILQQVMTLNPLTPFIQITLWCFDAPVSSQAWAHALLITFVSLLFGSKILIIAKNKVAEMI